MRRLAKNSKRKELLNHIGCEVLTPDWGNFIRGKILGVYKDPLSRSDISYLISGYKNGNCFIDTDRCYVITDEQKHLAQKYGISQGDKVTFCVGNIMEGIVLCLYDNCCIRTDTGGIRDLSEILTVNGEKYENR